MNLYALAAGITIAIYVVVKFRKLKPEQRKGVYPVLLATFPLYYWVFAAYGADFGALIYELFAGLLFMVLAYGAYKINSAIALLVLSFGYVAHAIYDVAHNSLFINPGVPLWWPEFCGAVDLLIGIYLLFMAVSLRSAQSSSA